MNGIGFRESHLNPGLFIIYKDKVHIGSIDYDDYERHIYGYAISSQYQNKGYGQKALCMFLRKFSIDAANPIYLDVAIENYRAIHVYKKLGFVIYDTGKISRCHYMKIERLQELIPAV